MKHLAVALLLLSTSAAADTAPLSKNARPVQKLTRTFTCPHGVTIDKAGASIADCVQDALTRGNAAAPINFVKTDVSIDMLLDRFDPKALVLDAGGVVTGKLVKTVRSKAIATKPTTGSAFVFVDDKVFAATAIGSVYKPTPLPSMLFYVTDEERTVPWYTPDASEQPASGYQYVVADGTLKVRCCFAPQRAKAAAPAHATTKAAIPPIVTPPVVKQRATK